MNYRHAYHAGNICDIVKHAALGHLIDFMRSKDKPFAVLDTHAGCGLYDLSDPRAQRTGESLVGAQRLWARRDRLRDVAGAYLDVLTALNSDGLLRYYPGSPMLARRLVRDCDRVVACELHPEDVRDLRRLFHGDKQVQVHHRDGYEALRGLLPFAEKRGLILMDPPFERPDEIACLVAALQEIHRRFPQAVVAVWYPIKERPALWRFYESLAGAGLPDLLKAEFIFRPEVRHDRLNGSGYVFMNAPWKLDERLAALFPALHEALETEMRESVIAPLV